MTIDATPRMAALSGVWTALGMSSIETWMRQHTHDIVAGRTLWAGGAVVFFFAPAFLFVLGRRHLSMPGSFWWPVRHPHDPQIREFWRSRWRDSRNLCLRMLCWFLGSAAGILICSVVRW